MEDYLSNHCINFGSSYCIPEVAKWRYAQQLRNGEPIPIKPIPIELNKRCKECDEFILKEKPEVCPYCAEKRFSLLTQTSGGWPESREGIQPFQEVYSCKSCGKEFSVDTRPKKQ